MAAADTHLPPEPEGSVGERVRVWLYRAWSHTLRRQAWFLGSDNPALRGLFMGATKRQAQRAHAAWAEDRRLDGRPPLTLSPTPCSDGAAMRREIGALPAEAVAQLCGSDDAEDVAAYAAAWAEWVGEQGPGAGWDGWEQCHEDFVAALRDCVLDLFGA